MEMDTAPVFIGETVDAVVCPVTCQQFSLRRLSKQRRECTVLYNLVKYRTAKNPFIRRLLCTQGNTLHRKMKEIIERCLLLFWLLPGFLYLSSWSTLMVEGLGHQHSLHRGVCSYCETSLVSYPVLPVQLVHPDGGGSRPPAFPS